MGYMTTMSKKYPRTKNLFHEVMFAKDLMKIIKAGEIEAEPEFILDLGLAIRAGMLELLEDFDFKEGELFSL